MIHIREEKKNDFLIMMLEGKMKKISNTSALDLTLLEENVYPDENDGLMHWDQQIEHILSISSIFK